MDKQEADLIIAEQDKSTEEILKAIAEVNQHNIKGFTGIEINGVRFSNIGEMLRYMEMQRDRLTKAKEIIREYMRFEPMIGICSFYSEEYEKTKAKAEQFLKNNA